MYTDQMGDAILLSRWFASKKKRERCIRAGYSQCQWKIYLMVLICHGFLLVDAEVRVLPVSVMEGDSVTLMSDVKIPGQDRIMWYFNDDQIAYITPNQTAICTDGQCEEGLKDRLKLDQTGSLTITDITDTDSGLYTCFIGSSAGDGFHVSVQGAPDEQRNNIHLVKKGKSVTLDPRGLKNTNDVMMWSFHDTLIADITGDQRKICEDVRCKERFRDRLELDQTGSLIITNTRNTDAGEYTLKITSNRERYSTSSIKIFRVFVTVLESGPSPSAEAVICAAAALLLLAAAIGDWLYRWRSRKETLKI